MDEYLSWDPAYSTQLGWHKYDWLLRDFSPTAIEHQSIRCSQLIAELKTYSTERLSPDQRVDRDLAEHLLKLWLFEIEGLRMHEKVSSAATDIGNSLFLLMVRDHPPLEDRLDAIIARLEAVPQFLERSKAALRIPYRAWNEEALEAGRQMPALLRNIESLVQGKPVSHDKRERLKRAVTKAAEELERHNYWLFHTVIPTSSPRYALTPGEYANYLLLKGYGVTADEALRIGEVYLDLAKRRLREVAKEMLPGGNPAKAIEMMRSDCPKTFQDAFREYKGTVSRCREFVMKAGLVTIPPGEELSVIETPEFMRPLCPFATQIEPGRFDNCRSGFFLVTPTGDNKESLKEHSFVSIANSTAHEAYPGHHVQAVCARSHPSYIRALSFSPDFVEGWGLYVEELMLASGFNSTPVGRLNNITDLIYRIVRLIVEIKLPKGFLTLDSAAEMFKKECGTEMDYARMEARACAMLPTFYSSYLLGKLAMMQLREEVREAMGDRFTLRVFHDTLLYSGTLPMKLVRDAVAVRLKESHGIELLPRKESLYKYAIRRAREGKI
ncbi:MAG: DUF885 domain-containing protein [Candidatus Thermoplasmatota archaeon]|nr:DUF885 domain-containing protein [Candidatus Thermoplasmatota archaeon]